MPDAGGRPEEGEPAAGIVVRPARPQDARSFLDAYRSVAAERRYIQTESVTRPARFYRRLFRHSMDDRAAQLLALDGDRVVGSLSIRRDEHPATRHVATLGMFVVSGYRSHGIGGVLMERALGWARRSGVERLELTVYPHNDAAIALYRKFGFVEEGRLVRHAKKSYGYEDEILMAVWLEEGSSSEAVAPDRDLDMRGPGRKEGSSSEAVAPDRDLDMRGPGRKGDERT